MRRMQALGPLVLTLGTLAVAACEEEEKTKLEAPAGCGDEDPRPQSVTLRNDSTDAIYVVGPIGKTLFDVSRDGEAYDTTQPICTCETEMTQGTSCVASGPDTWIVVVQPGASWSFQWSGLAVLERGESCSDGLASCDQLVRVPDGVYQVAVPIASDVQGCFLGGCVCQSGETSCRLEASGPTATPVTTLTGDLDVGEGTLELVYTGT